MVSREHIEKYLHLFLTTEYFSNYEEEISIWESGAEAVCCITLS